MIIAVLSCSKNEDTFLPFYELMERNFPEHPQIIYFTDGIINPYYKTIPIENKLSTWTKGFREFLNQIYHKQILLMIDDCFIRNPVDTKRVARSIRSARKESGMNREELAKEIGCKESTVWDWECGYRIPTKKNREKLKEVRGWEMCL